MQSSTSSRSRAPNRGSCSSTGRAADPSTVSTASRIARVSSAARRLERTEGLVIASQIVDVLAIARQVLGLGEPGDGLLEPLAQSLECRRTRGDQPSSFCALALLAQSRSTSLRSGRSRMASCSISMLGAHQLGDRPCGIADRNLESAADIDDFTDAGLGPERGDEALDRIADEIEIAGRVDAAELHLAMARRDLGDDRGNRPRARIAGDRRC